MNKLLVPFCIVFMFVLSGCQSNQPLTHSYEGDIHIRSIEVIFDPIREAPEDGKDPLAIINQVQKLAQEVKELFDPKESDALMAQLTGFEQVLVEGLRSSAKLPIVMPGGGEVDMFYGDYGELTKITFTYPYVDAPVIDLYANVYYPVSSSLFIGDDDVNRQTIKLTPEMKLYINGNTKSGKAFWRHSVKYKSDREYTFGNDYILGLSTSKIEEGEIFLIPLAKGIVAQL